VGTDYTGTVTPRPQSTYTNSCPPQSTIWERRSLESTQILLRYYFVSLQTLKMVLRLSGDTTTSVTAYSL
ncbi:uncharacterized protein METZ01_LOCUS293456, partial [marine metagenome]